MNKIKKTALNAMAFTDPCSFCAYRRGLIKCIVSPCPNCVVFDGDNQPIFVNKEITIKIPKRRF